MDIDYRIFIEICAVNFFRLYEYQITYRIYFYFICDHKYISVLSKSQDHVLISQWG